MDVLIRKREDSFEVGIKYDRLRSWAWKINKVEMLNFVGSLFPDNPAYRVPVSDSDD